MLPPRLSRAVLLVISLAGALAACGGGSESSDTRGSGGAGAGGVTGSTVGVGGAGATASGGSGTGGSNVVTPNRSCTSPSPAFTADEQMLVDLPADSWFSPPDTKIRPLCPSGLDGCANIIEAWSGGTFDPVHNQMLIFGGGHADYAGNEVYAFDTGSLGWTRLTDPSSPDLQDQDPLADGQPASRHSYDGISYITHADRMLVHGGSMWHSGNGSDVSWAFDPGAKTWTNRDPQPAAPASPLDQASAYDPGTKRVYFHLTNMLAAYDWDTNAWTTLQDYGEPPFWPRYEVSSDKRGLIDQKRGLLWFFGSGLVLVYDIASGKHVTDDWITTGGTTFTNADFVAGYAGELITTGGGEIITAAAPGVDYDTASDDLVGWVGGAPWILDLDSKTWTQSAATGGPAATAQHGTYGRWRYIPRLNVFMLVNSVDEDVYFYKHTAGCGQ